MVHSRLEKWLTSCRCRGFVTVGCIWKQMRPQNQAEDMRVTFRMWNSWCNSRDWVWSIHCSEPLCQTHIFFKHGLMPPGLFSLLLFSQEGPRTSGPPIFHLLKAGVESLCHHAQFANTWDTGLLRFPYAHNATLHALGLLVVLSLER